MPNGRDITPVVNKLLALPFVVRIATKDWHPVDHISFASNHRGKKAFVDTTTITNPSNAAESYESRLWPVHCVQHTPGAALVPELHTQLLHLVIEKGQSKDVEMYSAFYSPLQRPRCCDSGLADVLRGKGVTDVFVVGLAFDYCVRATAVDARKEGFRTYIVGEGTKAVDEAAWDEVVLDLERAGVQVVGMDGEEIRRLVKLQRWVEE